MSIYIAPLLLKLILVGVIIGASAKVFEIEELGHYCVMMFSLYIFWESHRVHI